MRLVFRCCEAPQFMGQGPRCNVALGILPRKQYGREGQMGCTTGVRQCKLRTGLTVQESGHPYADC